MRKHIGAFTIFIDKINKKMYSIDRIVRIVASKTV